jgi:hypothetical protein
MIESYDNAKEELKRIDHLIYVTLKYTRTVDVLLSVVERMVNSYEFIIEALIIKAKDEGTLPEDVNNPIAKANFVLKTYSSAVLTRNIKKYLMFRKLRRVEYTAKNEFRRHVTMTAFVDEQKIEVHIDSITSDFHELRKVLEILQNMVTEQKND